MIGFYLSKINSISYACFRYGEIYPEQKIPTGDSQSDTTTFEMNPDILVNVFKSGYNKGSERFKQVEIFPHELDNLQKNLLYFDIKKVFDSEQRTWQSPDTMNKNTFLDIEVTYKFAVNQVRFNTGLNEDFMAALKDTNNKQNFITPLLTDYELNHRQIVLYIVDCEVLSCSIEAR